jgi:futalosine hydrolase
MGNTRVALTICGVGKTNAAHGAALLFERFRPSRFFVLGVAGAYPSCGLDIGDIAIGECEIYGDEGLLTDAGLQTLDTLQLPLASVGTNEFYNEFPLFIPEIIRSHRHKGPFITVSGITGNLKAADKTKRRFNAICENMEGAAVAHIGVLNNIPVTEIRGISNIIEDRTGEPVDKAALLSAAENVQRFFISKLLC